MGTGAGLNDAERTSITRMFGPNCNVKSTAMVRLYVTPPNGIVWKFTNIIGVLAVMNDNNMKGHFLRIVDIKNMRITFEQEIYEFFDYKSPRAWFHTFESDNVVHGFSFANDGEARQLFDLVNTICDTINGPNAPPRPRNPAGPPQFISQTSMSNLNGPTTPTATTTVTTAPLSAGDDKKKKKKEAKEAKEKKKKSKKKDEHVLEISGPTNFKHDSHIGWNATKGFEIVNIPPEWKKLFQQAGIRKSELRDGETAHMLMNIVGAQLGAPPGPPPGPPGHPPGPPGHPPGPGYPSGHPPGPPGHHAGPGYPSGPPPGPPGGANRASMVRSSSDMAVGRSPPAPPPGGNLARASRPPGFAPPTGGAPPPPPPPPPAGGPPPPPPPMMPKSQSTPSIPSGSNNDSRSDLLSAIRGGTQLRKVDEAALPDISALPEQESKSIVDTLAIAIQARRQNIREEDDEDEDDDDEDDEWSD